MRTPPRSTTLLCLVLALHGCGKEGQTHSPDAAATPNAKPTTDAQLALAHFVTADGMHGFVLDRSGTPIKLQIDGERDVYELTQREVRDDRDVLLGYQLVDPQDQVRVLIGKDGSITYVRGKDELPASANETASPLGAPTIAGPPVAPSAPPPPYAKLAAQLTAQSVRVRFPEFDAKDSADLAKVRAAIAKADAAMFVHYVDPGERGWPARAEVVPSAFSGFSYGGGDFATDADESARYKALTKHGALVIGVSSPDRDQGNHILVRRADARDRLTDGTPGLVWEVEGSKVVLVTLDGARYVVDLDQGSEGGTPPVARGAGPKAGWPAPLQDTFADVTVVSSLVKAGVEPQETLDELAAIDAAWNECVAKGWKPTRIAQNVNYAAKAVKIHQGCRKPMQRLEAALVRFIDARTKARKALYDEAAARVEAVGATK
ncbi:MAG: hypothetical protein KDK70_16865 [Myxococcales bacterium]|nr:hypothetical protein [Myxococcales bacterium]